MSRQWFVLATLICAAMVALSATAQPLIVDLPQATPTATVELDVAHQLAPRRTRADCIAEAMMSGDIVVCAPLDDQQLPVPEVYGPQAGSTDGAAIDPHGVPCGASISNDCYGSINLLVAIPAAIGIVQLLIDPERNLGEGPPIPERFRGANR